MIYFLWSAKSRRNKFFKIVCRGESTTDLRQTIAKLRVDVDDTNEDGLTALMIATHYDRALTVRALIDMGCDVDKTREMPYRSKHTRFNGYTALMIAIEMKHLWIVRILVEDGHASIGLKNPRGRTAIQMAVDSNQLQLADYLTYWYLNPMGVHKHGSGKASGLDKPKRLNTTGAGCIPIYIALPPGAFHWSQMQSPTTLSAETLSSTLEEVSFHHKIPKSSESIEDDPDQSAMFISNDDTQSNPEKYFYAPSTPSTQKSHQSKFFPETH